ncbi:MAG: hypothetical protein QXW04_01935 [Candidatus Aenigmatarchaeota archaeon]|nr:hypothetical protein [Candidatus Aenigmarchaeota archaeon]
MALFDIFKKKEKREELKSIDKEFREFREFELPKPTENTQKFSEISLPIQSHSQNPQDRLFLIETKIENLRIYLEMINSKLDRLETLLKSKGLI